LLPPESRGQEQIPYTGYEGVYKVRRLHFHEYPGCGQEDQEFESNLSYRASSRPAWDYIQNSVSTKQNTELRKKSRQMRWLSPLISALRRPKQKNNKLEISLSYTASSRYGWEYTRVSGASSPPSTSACLNSYHSISSTPHPGVPTLSMGLLMTSSPSTSSINSVYSP
jgi:hypothetical protein